MANLLFRRGAAAAHRRWFVLAAWVAVLAAVGVGAATLSKPTSRTKIAGRPSHGAVRVSSSVGYPSAARRDGQG
jgi:RND superfamily putative drug exporter